MQAELLHQGVCVAPTWAQQCSQLCTFLDVRGMVTFICQVWEKSLRALTALKYTIPRTSATSFGCSDNLGQLEATLYEDCC